jgi:tetratricopeptide (TPR) repeat protein
MEVAWMSRFKVPSRSQETTEHAEIVSQVNFATNAILKLMADHCSRLPDSQEALPDLLLMKGIENLFRLEKTKHKDGEDNLREALNMRSSSQVYAWLAFSSVFKLGEKISEFSQSDREETEFFARRAIEIDPNNALSLSLCAHVFSFVLNDTEFASDLLDKSLKINPMHAISWDLFSVLHAYIGKPEVGLKCAKWARRIGEYSPYAYFYDASCCINAALTGRHEEAVQFGQHALSVRPNFKPPLRYMIASAGYLDDRRYTKKLVDQLLEREPDFSAREFLSSRHLRLTAEQKTHLDKGFRRAGLS